MLMVKIRNVLVVKMQHMGRSLSKIRPLRTSDSQQLDVTGPEFIICCWSERAHASGLCGHLLSLFVLSGLRACAPRPPGAGPVSGLRLGRRVLVL